MRAAYTYNGLHQRASRRAAANTTIGLATNDLGNLYYYDSAWRLCEERAATHWDGSAEFTPAKITQRFWCPLYIDALIATQTDTSGADPGPGADGDFSDATSLDTLYAVCDRKYDVIAMTDADGNLKERTEYSPYGVARHRPPADLNGDGKIDGVDQLILFNAWGASLGSGVYNPDADINFDGQVNGADFLILSNNFGADPAPAGAISKLGNTVGYSGYLHDDAIGMSLARFRWYDAETGRWATRDPVGHIIYDSNLYQYVTASPLNFVDPHGLEACSPNDRGKVRQRSSGEFRLTPSGISPSDDRAFKVTLRVINTVEVVGMMVRLRVDGIMLTIVEYTAGKAINPAEPQNIYEAAKGRISDWFGWDIYTEVVRERCRCNRIFRSRCSWDRESSHFHRCSSEFNDEIGLPGRGFNPKELVPSTFDDCLRQAMHDDHSGCPTK